MPVNLVNLSDWKESETRIARSVLSRGRRQRVTDDVKRPVAARCSDEGWSTPDDVSVSLTQETPIWPRYTNTVGQAP